jgi:hypothetical protein
LSTRQLLERAITDEPANINHYLQLSDLLPYFPQFAAGISAGFPGR